jgi:hypothetical protein
VKRAALLALVACACAPEKPPAPAKVALDCATPFETLKARVLTQELAAAPKDGSPYRFYSTPDGRTSYVITEPDAPSHPAILSQEAADGTVVTTGCRYGDAKAYDELLKYLDSLKAWRRSGSKS